MDYVTVSSCPLCGFSESQTFDRRVFRKFPVENRLCSRCGLVFQSPRMSDEALSDFYEAEYRLAYQNKEGPTPKDIFIQENRATSLINFIKKNVAQPVEVSSFLDIGCSTGILIERINQVYNLDGVGVEPGEAYRTYATRRGIKVYPSLDKVEAPHSNYFSLVSLIHVLEHLVDPVRYLIQLKSKFIVANGLLLVEVPNLYAHDCFEVAHMVSFSAHTLKETLHAAGYALIALRSHGIPRSKLLPLYITALARPVENPHLEPQIHPENQVKLKRQLGMLQRKTLERLANRWAWLPLPQG